MWTEYLPADEREEPAPEPPKKEYPVCEMCGSEDVVLDATAKWNFETQRWELAGTMDSATCEDCGDERDLRWEEV